MQPFAILMLGDVVGKSGRQALARHLPRLKASLGVDMVIVNGENAANGMGLTPKIADELFAAGVDVLTSGNHIWRFREIVDYLKRQPRLLRPANYPPTTPGVGSWVWISREGVRVGVINLLGRTFMDAADCPFACVDRLLSAWEQERACDLVVVDFHAEATSEKNAMGYYLDGRVTAVVGTHTHIPTADARRLPRGSGFITDVGMSGCYQSVIGVTVESVLPGFLTRMPVRFETAEGEATLCGVKIVAMVGSVGCLSMEPVRFGPDLSATHP
ncbi:MAG: TIGR00282 family metallophosphoesterase [Magnetococcales bacterium]|nr:TIGR00282 family metallophosphoesterase [Magnetococcales bacterium]